MTDKVLENRVRRMANRQGLRLVKSRRRDPRATDYGRCMLVTIATDDVQYGAATGRIDGTLEGCLKALEGE